MTKKIKNAGSCIMLFAAYLFSCQLQAQEKQITGTVTYSENSQPASGVSVHAKGTRNIVMTDADGHYKITVNNSVTALVFSSATYVSLEEAIKDRSVINVKLTPDVKALSDVVVIGYQTVRRKDLLASVSSISAKDLKDIPINSAAEALNGRLAGVTATTSEGSPDADIRIRVRGGMSITQDNSPLYIVDGVQVENGLNMLSPQDIQSIDVLKDAAATAIYGARGANGVVIITTKSGKPGKTVVSYNGYVGIKNLTKELDVLSPYDYVIYQSERSRGNTTDSTSFLSDFGTTWDTLSNYKNVSPVDWQDKVLGRTGIATTQNVSVSGGNKKLVYNFGYTYNDEKAIVINSNYKRHLLNLKTDYSILKNLKLSIGARYTSQNVFGAGVSDNKGSSYNRLRNVIKYRPFLSPDQSITDEDALADPNVGNGLVLYNPIDLANSEFRHKSTDEFNGTASLTYTFLKKFSFRSTFGYDRTNMINRQFYDSITPYAIFQGGRLPIAGLDTTTATTITNSNVLTYSLKNWKDKHDFDFLVGEETYDLRTETSNQLFKNYPLLTTPDEAFKNTSLGTSFTGYPRLAKTRYTNLSFFSRINYSFKDRYLFSFNIRADGASKFAPGKQWGYFPAGSAAWKIKNEKFLKDVDFISDLKLRAGFGIVGNNRIADYLYLTTFRNDGSYYYGLNNEAIYAYYPSSLVNQNLQWEATLSRNLGLDISVLKNRVNLSVDIYNNTSKNLLLNVPIASTYGYTNQLQNVGKTSNKGVEFQLNTVVIQKPNNFRYVIDFNMSFNRNNILALGSNQTSFTTQGWSGVSGQPTDYITQVGTPVSAMWGLVSDGFYKVDDFDYNSSTGQYTLKAGVVSDASIIGSANLMPGAIKFKDLDSNGSVDLDHDRTIIGNPNPKATGGINQTFTFKRWDLSLFLNFSIGNDVYNANKIEFTNGYTSNANLLAVMNDRWKVVTPTGATAEWTNGTNVFGIPPDQLSALNANAKIWIPIKGAGAFYPSSWAIEDGSFLRFNNLTIGYTVPVKKVFTRLRFYMTANNFAIITNYSGYDPEVNVRASNPLTQGLDYSAYPKSRSFIFGVNATF